MCTLQFKNKPKKMKSAQLVKDSYFTWGVPALVDIHKQYTFIKKKNISKMSTKQQCCPLDAVCLHS